MVSDGRKNVKRETRCTSVHWCTSSTVWNLILKEVKFWMANDVHLRTLVHLWGWLGVKMGCFMANIQYILCICVYYAQYMEARRFFRTSRCTSGVHHIFDVHLMYTYRPVGRFPR